MDDIQIKDLEERFNNLLPYVIHESCSGQGFMDTEKWLKSTFSYNISAGRKHRGLALVQSFQCLAGGKATEEDLNNALILGWCIEMLHAFFIVVDDVVDNSETRRWKPCWYTLQVVGLSAVNDAIYIQSAIYYLIKKNMKRKPYYMDIVELFHDATLQTALGQILDTMASKETNIQNFTMERFNVIAQQKAGYDSFYLPVACALKMAGIKDKFILEETKIIQLRMGLLWQIQNDYCDCFEDPEVVGKIGNDIEENKCSWLVAQALLRCNDQQKLLLQGNYGSKSSDKVVKVKKLYRELNLPEIYDQHLKNLYLEILQLIDRASASLPKEMFLFYLEKVYMGLK